MKKLLTFLSIALMLLFAAIYSGCLLFNNNNSDDDDDNDTYTKQINANDLELEYIVYEESYIKVYVTPLVDIEDLHAQVCFYQWKNFLNQDSQWIDEKFIEKGKTYTLYQTISDEKPFDRVSLLSISGKKDEQSIDFTEKKRIGTIRSKPENLNTEMFSFRFDNSYAGNTVIGRLYIISPVDLWDVNFSVSYTDENSNKNYIQPNLKVDEVIANEEFYIILGKLVGDDIKVTNLSIKEATSREITARIINEELQITTKE